MENYIYMASGDIWVRLLGYMSEAAHHSPATSGGALAIPGCSQPGRKLKDHRVDTLTCSRHTSEKARLLGSPFERTYTYMLGSEPRRAGAVRCR